MESNFYNIFRNTMRIILNSVVEKDKGRIINPCSPTQIISLVLIFKVGAKIKLMSAII